MDEARNSCNPIQAKEVGWYYFHGRYRDRIRLDKKGFLYVISDWSWSHNNSERFEEIGKRMKVAGIYDD